MTARQTARQRNGSAAEDAATGYLLALGWQVLARNVRLGRDEIDVVAFDPGPPPAVVCVEVRSGRSADFGAPEERVDRRKVAHLYRALAGLRASPPAPGWPAGSWRVDLLVVDRRSGRLDIRHLRALVPAD